MLISSPHQTRVDVLPIHYARVYNRASPDQRSHRGDRTLIHQSIPNILCVPRRFHVPGAMLRVVKRRHRRGDGKLVDRAIVMSQSTQYIVGLIPSSMASGRPPPPIDWNCRYLSVPTKLNPFHRCINTSALKDLQRLKNWVHSSA